MDKKNVEYIINIVCTDEENNCNVSSNKDTIRKSHLLAVMCQLLVNEIYKSFEEEGESTERVGDILKKMIDINLEKIKEKDSKRCEEQDFICTRNDMKPWQ